LPREKAIFICFVIALSNSPGIINQAINLIKTEGLDEVSRTRITREAKAMGRFGSHPHIVTVFDLDEQPRSFGDEAFLGILGEQLGPPG